MGHELRQSNAVSCPPFLSGLNTCCPSNDGSEPGCCQGDMSGMLFFSPCVSSLFNFVMGTLSGGHLHTWRISEKPIHSPGTRQCFRKAHPHVNQSGFRAIASGGAHCWICQSNCHRCKTWVVVFGFPLLFLLFFPVSFERRRCWVRTRVSSWVSATTTGPSSPRSAWRTPTRAPARAWTAYFS